MTENRIHQFSTHAHDHGLEVGVEISKITTLARIKTSRFVFSGWSLLLPFVASVAISSVTSADQTPSAAQKFLKPALPSAAPAAKTSGSGAPAAATPAATIESSGTDKIVTLPTARDDERTTMIMNSLAKQAGWFPNLKIKVAQGMVTFTGTAKDAQQVEWLAKTADRMPGVIAVINQTELEHPAVTDLTPAWDELRRLTNSAKKSLPLIILAVGMLVIFLVLGTYLSRFMRTVWGKHISNPFLLATVSKLTMVPIWAIFFYLTLRTAGLSGLATTIIGGTGAASLVIGFAFKGIAENYLSGLLLAIRSPFTKGDEIQVDKYAGFVQSLNMRGTTIIDYEGNVVLIPNSIVIQSVIRNRTSNSNTRSTFTISISYSDSVSRAQDLIAEILKSMPEILVKPGPSVSVDKLSSSGIDLAIFFWFDAAKSNGDKIKSALVGQIKDQLLASDFHIPDAAREIIFADTLKVHVLQTEEEADATDQKRGAQIKAKATAQLLDQKSAPPVVKTDDEEDVRALAEEAKKAGARDGGDLLGPKRTT